MSVYFDTRKQLFIARKYKDGKYFYIGQFDSLGDAERAEREWQERLDDARAEERRKYTGDWYQAKKKEQKDLYKKYPPYRKG